LTSHCVKLTSCFVKVGPRLPLYRSPEQERLLGELFVFADEPISLRELARRAGTSVGGAHKEVERLESAGLVRSTSAGRNRLIEANPSSPVYTELRGLLLKTLGPGPLRRTALADVDGIEDAFIYGSWADPAEKAPADIGTEWEEGDGSFERAVKTGQGIDLRLNACQGSERVRGRTGSLFRGALSQKRKATSAPKPDRYRHGCPRAVGKKGRAQSLDSAP